MIFFAHNHTAILTESFPLCLACEAMKALSYSVAYSASFELVPGTCSVEVKMGPIQPSTRFMEHLSFNCN